MKPEVVLVVYKIKHGCKQSFLNLLKDHIPTLKKWELITDRPPMILEDSDEFIIESFEWTSKEASTKAHEIPEIGMIWEKMAEFVEFSSLADLPSANGRFAHFSGITL